MTGPDDGVSPQPPPAGAAEVFGDNFDRARRYADLLCVEGVQRGLIGPREPARIWTRHLLNAAALGAYVPDGADVVDVGSGAGLPGIPLWLARPAVRMTLLEPMARRVAFCEEVRDLLDLEVTVVRSRAEDARPGCADVVVVRAVAPLERLAGLTLPMLKPGGVLLALKGDRAPDEVRAAQAELTRLGAGPAEIHPVGVGEERTFVVVVPAPVKAIR